MPRAYDLTALMQQLVQETQPELDDSQQPVNVFNQSAQEKAGVKAAYTNTAAVPAFNWDGAICGEATWS